MQCRTRNNGQADDSAAKSCSTNNYIEKNNRNIIVLIFCIVFAIFLCIIVSSYVYNRISPKIFTLLLLFVILMYIFLFLYSYDIFYFKTAVNFLDYRKNRNLANAVKDLSTITKTDLQKKLYGSKKDWDEKNCECEEMPAIYPTETNVSVKNIPGYYYYDGGYDYDSDYYYYHYHSYYYYYYSSSFAHSARQGRKVEMLGWSQEGHNHWYSTSCSKNSMVRKPNVAFTVVMRAIALRQSCLISGDQVGC